MDPVGHTTGSHNLHTHVIAAIWFYTYIFEDHCLELELHTLWSVYFTAISSCNVKVIGFLGKCKLFWFKISTFDPISYFSGIRIFVLSLH